MIAKKTRAAFLLGCSAAIAATASSPAAAQEIERAEPADEAQQDSTAPDTDSQTEPADETMAASDDGGGTDILSRNTVRVLFDARLAAANGERSWTDRGLGKTRFDGTSDGDYELYAVPVEAAIIWTPRLTRSLSANVSAGWQRDQDNEFDVMEAFVNFLPPQTGPIGVHLRAGLMWPEISLEHSTGGAWSVVDTITPSAINSWVGEEVKVLGLEGTVRTDLGQHTFALTGGVFGFNDTSGTLLSFRGWALHDEKATAFGYFELPPFNEFISHLQEDRTRSLLEIDDRPGFYGRLDWRPPAPFGAALFYYDNRGDPEAFTPAGQWGWRTRFWNLGVNADIGSNTRLLAQGMTGSTIMGFPQNDRRWVHTKFRSAFVLVSHRLDDKWNVAGRIEAFRTREIGSQMSPMESERGWSWTAAVKYLVYDHVTVKAEALNVRSRRGVRATHLGIDPFQAQTVFQIALGVAL